jgi:ankyrin repeat protein
MTRHQGFRPPCRFTARPAFSSNSFFLSLLLATACVGWVACQQPPRQRPAANDEVVALIDKLRDVAEEDFGYMATMSGGGFLPLGTSQAWTFVLGQQKAPARSDTLRELVKRGAAAVPQLVAHLDDKRPTKITIKHESVMGAMFFNDEYDYNARTAKGRPEGVNRDSLPGGRGRNTHTVTVGDLCFVALGQIVNRHFNAVRYQPTACIMINSPTNSEALRKVIKKEWGDLTPGRHKASLVRDFVEPDSEYRRSSACLRLGYYYPEALEPLALKQLAAPRYDVFEVEALAREKLYRIKDAKGRKKLFDAFVAKRGEVALQGCLLQLFGDLSTQEADEEGRLSPPLKAKYAARACLVELYGYPGTVKSKECPYLLPTENAVQARFIDALAFFPSPKLDEAVRAVLHSADDDYLAKACLRYLVGRGADRDIRQYVEHRLKGANPGRRAELESMLERVGWTALHAAAETGEPAVVENLIRKRADVNARAANGQTPLHVAAAHGNYGAIDALLKHKANPNVKDKEGRTPAQLGIEYDAAVKQLLDAGAEPSDILVASFAGRAELVKDFLAKDKSSAKSKTRSGETALHFAARFGHLKVAEVLLHNGADVNARNDSQFTPLHWAAGYGRPEMVTLLLANKADRSAKSWDGKTPLEWARESRNEKVIRLLEKAP